MGNDLIKLKRKKSSLSIELIKKSISREKSIDILYRELSILYDSYGEGVSISSFAKEIHTISKHGESKFIDFIGKGVRKDIRIMAYDLIRTLTLEDLIYSLEGNLYFKVLSLNSRVEELRGVISSTSSPSKAAGAILRRAGLMASLIPLYARSAINR